MRKIARRRFSTTGQQTASARPALSAGDPSVTHRLVNAKNRVVVDHTTIWRWIQRYAPQLQTAYRP
jgi:hypothetical protein